jgi:Flp pilus assembly protein TadD
MSWAPAFELAKGMWEHRRMKLFVVFTIVVLCTLSAGASAQDAAVPSVDAAAGGEPALEGDLSEVLNRADLAYEEGNVVGAAQLYRRATRGESDGVEAHYKLGVVLALRGDLAGAISAWEIVVERRPEMARAQENIDRARKRLQAQTDDGADSPALRGTLEERLELAAVYLKERRAVMALRVLDPLADEHPDDGRVRLIRGTALAAAGRYEEAGVDLTLSLASRPGDPNVLEALGRLYLRTGDGPRAHYFLGRYLRRVDPGARNRDLDATRDIVAKLGAAQ